MARILFFKIRPSQEINKIRDGTLLEAEEILIYRKQPRNGSKKRVARILIFKIRPSQEINKIRDGTPLEAEEILTYRKKPRNGSLDVPSNVVRKKRVARILFFKLRPSQEINKIRDGTLLEAEEILIYRKKPRNGSVYHFSSKLDVPSNVLQKKRVAQILVFKIRPSQEILKIRDGTPSEWPSQEINKIRDGTLLEAEEILTYRKSPEMDRNGSVWYFSSKLDVPGNVLQKNRVARILIFKIRPSQEINKICDGTPLEAEEILTYRKKPRNGSVWHFSSKLDVPSNILQKKRVARILVFKIRPSQEILIIRDGTPSEKKRVAGILVFKIRSSQEILKLRDVRKKRLARILFFKIRPSQEINKIRDGTLLEAEEILIYRKKPRNGSVCHFSSKLDVPSNILQKKRVARILVFKIRPSQEILIIRDGTPSEMSSQEILKIRDVARILFFKIRPSQEINKIRDGTLLEAEEILIYRKQPRNGSKKRVARILIFKIRPSQEINKIRDGTPLEAEEILTYRKKPRNGSVCNVVRKKRVARILFFKLRPSQEINKIRDGTLLEAEEILIYRKKPRNGSVYHFSSKLDVPSNVLQKKRVAQILVFKIRPSQEILKIRDGTPSEWPSQEINKIRDGTLLEAEEILTYRKSPEMDRKLDVPGNVLQKNRVARILIFKIRPSQEINKICDGTPLEAEEILTYRKKPRNGSVWHFSSKLDVPSNILQKKRVARILVFKIRPSQEILIIRDGTPSEKKRVAGILVFKIRSSQEILKLRDVRKKRLARILFFKIRPSQEINKIRDGTLLEAEEILIYRKKPRNGSVCHFSSKLDVPSNVLQKKRVAQILVFKVRPSQEILKIRDGTPSEAEEILTYRKKP
ncbi:hypothetical protein OROMI_012983 [Orobanche minor]